MKMDRILIYELNWMGDILFSFPLIRAIRKAFPDSYIACVVVPRYADLLVHNPWINDVHVLSDNNKISSIVEKIKFINMIKKEGYDTCFMLKPSRTKTLMSSFAGITQRIGFSGKNASLTNAVEMPQGCIHRADQILSLAVAVDIEGADGAYEYFYSEEDVDHAETLLHNVGGGIERMVCINPGGNWKAKRWFSENFIELAGRLLEKYKDIEILVTGAEKDIDLTDRIVRMVNSDRCYTVAGKTSINELAVLFNKCNLVISADSGPLHLASATGTTTIGIFGPTTHKITGPRGKGENIVLQKEVECEVPCYVKECDLEYECMRIITVDDVFEAAGKVLEGQ